MYEEIVKQSIDALASRIVERMKAELQPPDSVLDVTALAKYLSVPRSWILERTAKNEIPCFRLSHKVIRFRQSEVDAWLAKKKKPENPFENKYPNKRKKRD